MPDSLPAVEDYEVAALSEPATGQPAGGDVYGLWTRPAGDLVLLIGDVSGKGAGASGLSAMARFFIEARSWEGFGPAEVLERTASMMCERLPEDTFITAFLAMICDGELRCANAGHLPPLPGPSLRFDRTARGEEGWRWASRPSRPIASTCCGWSPATCSSPTATA